MNINNRFAHCVSVNEAEELLRQILSSMIDEVEKQTVQNEYDTFLAFDLEEDCQKENHSNPFQGRYGNPGLEFSDDLLPYYEELLLGISDEGLISRGVICGKCKKNIQNDGYCKRCDPKADKPDHSDNYPPGMTRGNLIHVGEIEPDED